MSSRLARINADYLQARQDLAAGIICQAINNEPKEK